MKLRQVTLTDGTNGVVDLESIQLLVEATGDGCVIMFKSGAHLACRDRVSTILGTDYPPPQVIQ